MHTAVVVAMVGAGVAAVEGAGVVVGAGAVVGVKDNTLASRRVVCRQ